MRLLSSLRHSLERDVSPDADAQAATRRSNRRRLRVFAVVFLVVLLPGLLWNFLRPAEYRAIARVQITPGGTEPRPGASPLVPGGSSGEMPRSPSELLTQVQVLTSRPLLEKVGAALGRAGLPLPAGDPAARLREMISAEAVEGTEVVELQATGTHPEQLAAALNTLVDIYREDMKASYGVAAGEGLSQARQEAERLAATVQARRQRLEAFRSSSGVLSPEREENEAVARVKGLTTSLNVATEKLAVAEARQRAMQASGRGSAVGADDPTLANMEARASQIAEEIRQMERTYTPEFMRMDPRAKSLQTRLAEMERQIEAQRVASRQAALGVAQDEVASARATVEHLQAEIRSQRSGMQNFSQRFTQAKALEDDLAQIEKAGREAQERVAKLEASEQSRLPALNLVEAAGVPGRPFRPDYWRDALIVLGAAFGLGLLAMWFVELFNRQAPVQAPSSTTLIVPQPWAGLNPPAAPVPLPGEAPAPALAGASPGLLAATPRPPRELSQDEVVDLLSASAGEGRFVLGLLLMGLSTDEVAALNQGSLDRHSGLLRVGGSAPRSVKMPAWMAECRPSPIGGADAPLLQDAAGARLRPEDIQSILACAAFDAGLTGAAGVTADVLRHTCIAWLVRQGLRFSELAGLVGRPSAEALAMYAGMAPDGPKRSVAEIDPLMPALRAM